MPKVNFSEIYYKTYFLSRNKYFIKTIENTFSISSNQETVRLLKREDLDQIPSGYKYLHIGFVQVSIKPLTRIGLNTSALGCLRDYRNLYFKNSLLGLIEANLSNGLVFFNVGSNFSISLTDPNILDCLTLNLITSEYEMKLEIENLSITYRFYYKAMTTVSLRVKLTTSKRLTTLFMANLKNNYITPKKLKWDEINMSEKWTLDQVIETKEVQNFEANRIIETPDGNVEVYFSTSRRITIDKGISTSDISTSEKKKAQSRSTDIAYAMYELIRSKPEINIIDFDEF